MRTVTFEEYKKYIQLEERFAELVHRNKDFEIKLKFQTKKSNCDGRFVKLHLGDVIYDLYPFGFSEGLSSALLNHLKEL